MFRKIISLLNVINCFAFCVCCNAKTTDQSSIYAGDYHYEDNTISHVKRIVLEENRQSVKGTMTPVLKQEMFHDKNTIYVIRYDYDIQGKTIVMPEGCVLEFEGGSIKNGCLKGAFQILDCWHRIFYDIKFALEESFLYADYIRPEWFGAKGNYDYSIGKGVNDSYAITEAINAALLLKVHKVKFSSRTYYVRDAIEINSGDIVLEGVYGELREEFKFSKSKDDMTDRKNSTLISDTDNPIIITNQGGTHPVIIRNINFRQEYNKNTASTNTKAIWLKGWNGPQSPFLFEYCHFYKFRYAIYVYSDELAYNVSKLHIKHCAFGSNYWCVYFSPNSVKSNFYKLTGNVAGEFVFEDNACHHNVRGIRVGLNVASSSIIRNVFEGNLMYFFNGEKPTENYINYVGLHNGSTLQFENNYFEQNTVKHLKLNVTSMSEDFMDSYVTIKDNISVPDTSKGFFMKKICEIEQDGGDNYPDDILANHLHVLYSDYDFEVSSGRLGLLFHSVIKNVIFTGNCYVQLFTKEIPSYIVDNNLKTRSNSFFLNNEPIGVIKQATPSFVNGTLCYSLPSSINIGSVSVSSNTKDDITYLCAGTKVSRHENPTVYEMSKRSILSFKNTKNDKLTSIVYNSNEFDYMFVIRRERTTGNNNYTYQIAPFNSIISQVAVLYSCKKDISFYDVNWDFSPENIVVQENILKIKGQKTGNYVFDYGSSRYIIWSKGKWVDALGNIVTY